MTHHFPAWTTHSPRLMSHVTHSSWSTSIPRLNHSIILVIILTNHMINDTFSLAIFVLKFSHLSFSTDMLFLSKLTSLMLVNWISCHTPKYKTNLLVKIAVILLQFKISINMNLDTLAKTLLQFYHVCTDAEINMFNDKRQLFMKYILLISPTPAN